MLVRMFKRIIYITIVLSACFTIPRESLSIQDPDQRSQNFDVKITTLAETPKEYTIVSDSIKYSPDLRHVTYIAYKNKTAQFVVLDNKKSSEYYAISAGTPIFSPEENHHAYIAYRGEKGKEAFAVVDGNKSPVFDNIDHFQFSNDGKRFAYRAAKNGKQCIVIDNQIGKWYDGVPVKNNFKFSNDSKHIAYVA